MPIHNLMRNVALVNVSSAVTGSTSDHTFAGVDMRGYEGIAWVFCPTGNLTTGASFKVQGATSSGFSTGTRSDLTGTSIDATTTIADGAVVIDIYRPEHRWVRGVMVKTSTGDTVNSAVALAYNPAFAPVTHSTADVIGAEYHVHPATGTA